MPTQQEVDNFNADVRSKQTTADDLYPDFRAEYRVYDNGQIEYVFRRDVIPGEAAGTNGTPEAPDDPTPDDYRVRDDAAASVAEDMRGFGAAVQSFQRGGTAEVRVTFP